MSDHTPVEEDAKVKPFAEAEPGASAVELLLSAALLWSQRDGVPLLRALQTITSAPIDVLGSAVDAFLGRLEVGGPADVCIVDPQAHWTVQPSALLSQAKSTPFNGMQLPGQVRTTLVDGAVVFSR